MGTQIEILRLGWDEWNIDHIRKHEVTVAEVEECIRLRPIVRSTFKRRLIFIGPTKERRMLVVVLGENPSAAGTWYTFSARPASRKERALYDTTTESDQE